MINQRKWVLAIALILILIINSCEEKPQQSELFLSNLPSNILDYKGSPTSVKDLSFLSFSDQGAWFSYAFPNNPDFYGGFSGPFLMTQENGVWSSPVLSQLFLWDEKTNTPVDWNSFKVDQKAFPSHLEQQYKNEELKIVQKLVYLSGHTALISTEISNLSSKKLFLKPSWIGTSFRESLVFENRENKLLIHSANSSAQGIVQVIEGEILSFCASGSNYNFQLEAFELKPNESKELNISQTFIFLEYNQEQDDILAHDFNQTLNLRIGENGKGGDH